MFIIDVPLPIASPSSIPRDDRYLPWKLTWEPKNHSIEKKIPSSIRLHFWSSILAFGEVLYSRFLFIDLAILAESFLFIDLAITCVVKSIPTIPTGWRVGLSIHPYQVSCRFWILAVPRPPRMAERAGDGAWFHWHRRSNGMSGSVMKDVM